MVKKCTNIENALARGVKRNSSYLRDLLDDIDLCSDIKPEWVNIVGHLESVVYANHLHPKECLDLILDEQLYEYLGSREISAGHFAAALALYVAERYSLNIEGLPVPTESTSQEVFNIVISQLIKYLEVFYD